MMLPPPISSTVIIVVVGRLLASNAPGLETQPREFWTRQVVIANCDRLAALIISGADMDAQPDRSVAAVRIKAATMAHIGFRYCAERQPVGIRASRRR
jgi:hypothetical protein